MNASAVLEFPQLRRADLDADPLRQFDAWYRAAAAAIPEPEACAMATATTSGRPSVRMVLLKGYGPEGLRVFSNLSSRKADELRANPHTALLFYWREPFRQVRIEGTAVTLPRAEAAAYFATRPRGSQLGAWASRQSHPAKDRAEIEARVTHYEAQFQGRDVPMPEHWGGWRIVPEVWEFWQGRGLRLHDRFRYTRDGDGWKIERLQP